MARRLEIDLKETALELKSFLPQPKNSRQTERVQALELLNTPPTPTALPVATLMGRRDSTVKTWLRTSRQNGIAPLVEHPQVIRLSHLGPGLKLSWLGNELITEMNLNNESL
jgi:hypothetical protein